MFIVTTPIAQIIFLKISTHIEGGGSNFCLTLESAISELPIDSLHLFELVYELEEELDVELDDYELAALETLGDLITMVQQALKAAA
jgi:acyl carrier protein